MLLLKEIAMGRQVLLIAMVLVLAGCRANNVGSVREQPRAEISFAATAAYPRDAQTTEEFQITAVDDPRRRELILYNPTDRSIPASTVWVNQNFVHRVAGIGPRSSVTIDYRNLLEAGEGVQDLRRAGHEIHRVDLETPQGLVAVQGPARR
jgi:hypothetical protein